MVRECGGGSMSVCPGESGEGTAQRSCCSRGDLLRRGFSAAGLGKKATGREPKQRCRGESRRAALENGTCVVCQAWSVGSMREGGSRCRQAAR